MYFTGQFYDYLSRLHQGADSQAALNSFITEGNGYLLSYSGAILYNTAVQWDTEAKKRKFCFTNNPYDLISGQFNYVNPPIINLTGLSQTSSGQPLIITWTAITNSSIGITGVKIYKCFNTGSFCASWTLLNTLSGAQVTGVSYSDPITGGNGYYSYTISDLGGNPPYFANEVTGSIVQGQVVNSTLTSPS